MRDCKRSIISPSSYIEVAHKLFTYFILFIISEIDKISINQPSLKLEEVELDNEGAAEELNKFLNST